MDGGATRQTGDSKGLEDWHNTSGIALWSVILLGALILNSTLLLAFLKRPGLRTISNRFVMNLIVSNLLTCCILNPLLILDAPVVEIEPCMCSLVEGATALVTTSSVFSVLLIAIDQCLAVVDPLRYRTHIDTMRCGILIVSLWIISLAFSLFAALNPAPKSLWLICQPSQSQSSKNFSANSDVSVVNLTTNNDEQQPETSMTYDFILLVLNVFIYLLPFIGVCWSYIRIYSAAHNNSKRTRRTGSRPILSSGSFTQDYCPVRQDFSNEDFRKIPKISSLSSIDECTENSPSQMSRRFSDYGNQPSPIQEETSSVIFTVGSQKVYVTSRQSNDDTKEATTKSVPISVLKAQFLDKRHDENVNLLVKSRFQGGDDERQRKSSYDLTNEEQVMCSVDHFNVQNENSDDDDEDVEEGKRIMFGDDECAGQDVSSVKGIPCSPLVNEVMQTVSDKNDDMTCHPERLTTNQNHSADDAVHENNIHNDIYYKFSVENLQSNDLFGNVTPMVTVTPPHRDSLHRVSSTKSTSSYIHSLKYRISNGSLFKYREETRAARVSAFVIVMTLICWTPYYLVLILRNLPYDFGRNLPHETDTLALSLFISTAYISPILFGYRSKRVKKELKKLFCFKRELSYQHNRSLMAKKILKRRHSGNCEIDNRFSIFNCLYGKNKWPKEKVQCIQVPETALIVETCRSSFSSGASTQVSSSSTDCI
ncbi:dopamine D2-like receptor [Diachasmimorpha longicaudata]|uniref:dopamine D2-like receptor n=1 Tax=Diachasmimorpha longicaudata TaxID=58733 RepID=UPI0030B8C240